MEFKSRASNKLLSFVLIMCISRACHGQLMCYVCDDCAQITAQTPQFECNDDFFHTTGSTDSSVQTTTEQAKTTAGVTDTTDETKPTSAIIPTTDETSITSTTETKSPESTTKTSTENVKETTTETVTDLSTLKDAETTEESTSTTEEQPPSPPTVGPPKSTTAVPTPPAPGTVNLLDDVESLNNQTAAHEQHVNKDEVEVVDLEQGTTKPYKPSAEFRVRQLRAVSDVTFHCFKVHAEKVNGTMVVNRGCSRVQTNESVCGQWEAQHTNEKMNKCYPCSRTKCNGSSALNVSITALIVAVVAVFLHRK